jgi:hypothetical protein
MPQVIALSKMFSAFDPRSLHGCCLWADAASITGIANGASVSGTLSNLANTYISGQSVRFGISCTGTLKVSGRNNNNTILFNTGQTFDMTASAGTVNLSNYSLFFSGRHTGGTNGRILTSSVSQNQLFGYWGGLKKNLYVENNPSHLFAASADTIWDVMSHTRFTGGAYTLKWNGSQLLSGTSSTATLLLGLFINRQEPSDCEVGEIILYNRVLASAEVESVERYLCAKWGVGLNATLPLVPSMSTFVPALLNPNCILWLDAADTSTYTYSPGAQITGSWFDKSGNGNHAIASGVGATRLPTCSSNAVTNVFGTINNLPALVFQTTGTPNPLMKTTSNIPVYPLTVFLVASYVGTPGTGAILMDGFLGKRQIFHGASGSFPQTVYFSANSATTTFQGDVRITNSNIPFLITGVITATPQYTSYGNGNITAGNNPIAAENTTTSQWYIGGDRQGIFSFNGSIGEIIMCKTALSDNDRRQTEAYLIQKWGINPSISLVTNTTPPQTYAAIPYPAISNKYTWPQPANRSFSAIDLGGCVQWMDAYNVNGFSNPPANNASIPFWFDSSGIKAVYGYVNAIPVYRATGLNSRPTVDFTGSAGMISCNATTVYQTNKSSNITVFIVGQVNGGIGSWGTVWGHFSSGRHDLDIQLRQNGTLPSTLNWHTNNNNGAGISIAYSVGTPYLMVCTMSNASVMSFTQYLSTGTSTTVTSTEAVTWTGGIAPIWLGLSDTTEAYNSYISEVIYYQRVLPTTEQGMVIGYLANKWGFTLPTTATAPDTIYHARAQATIPVRGFATDGLMYYLSADDPNSWNGTAVWTDLMGTGVNMNLTGLSTPGLSSVPASFGPINSKWVGFSSVSAQYGYTNGEFQRSVYLKWTVEVWIQMTNNNTGTNPAIVTSKYSATWNNINYMLGVYSGAPAISAAYYVPGWVSTASIQMTVGIHHIVATYDGANLNLYQNGNLVTQSASGFTPGWSGGNASGGIHIMRRWDSAEYFDGALNTVRIYNRALSPSEVLINFVSESRDRGWVRKT